MYNQEGNADDPVDKARKLRNQRFGSSEMEKRRWRGSGFKMFRRGLKQEIKEEVLDEIRESESITVIERVDEEKAKQKIKTYLQSKKSKGEKKVDDIEMMEELEIPIEQVNEIIDKYTSDECEGKL